ncbi:hypothetical protein [Mesomycoplasma bovoculi]|uniref:Uncharacterized protein n=1 Tax=Mesomycoplasma bovoculi M165/69 TaxID=743966 RepID=W5USC5_9BACT|nr:hypothetical protein [Mesomycoplasma bovoculi]AHH45037.1 hypothetical protein MYB_00120 [Mesomycoplasma bovoculi M165/69]
MQFDKFAPYLPKHNILFNIYSQLIKQHSVVIWFNGNEGMYYFVKTRSANKDEMEKDQFFTEILITTDATAPYSLFKKIVSLIIRKFLEWMKKNLKSLMEKIIFQE